jgi:hypothetical protein
MKGVKKSIRKKIRIYNKDIWDRYQWSHEYYKEELKPAKIKQTTGGIRIHTVRKCKTQGF